MADKIKPVVVELRGKAHWAKIFEENRDKTGPKGAWEKDGGRCTIKLYLDDDEYEKLKAAKSQKQLKSDADGQYVDLDRKFVAPHTYGGAPRVFGPDGVTPWTIEDGLIGNGSEVIVYVTVYDGKGLMGTRLEVVQIVDHIEYESPEGDDGEYDPMAKFNLRDHSSKAAKPKATKAKTTKAPADDLDDEIPF